MVANGVVDPRWFARIGLALDDAERARIVEGARLHEAVTAELVLVTSWSDALRILESEDRESRNWNAQEAERERLWEVAAESFSESELLERLTAVREAWDRPLQAAARKAAERERIADARFPIEAALGAQTALHHAELARLANAGQGHPFHFTLALFTSGRWPLGHGTTRFFVF
jgi:hypothetical protein